MHSVCMLARVPGKEQWSERCDYICVCVNENQKGKIINCSKIEEKLNGFIENLNTNCFKIGQIFSKNLSLIN